MLWRCRGELAPACRRDSCRNNSHHARHQRLCCRAGHQRDPDRAAHDDHEARRRERRQLGTDAQQAWEDQAEGAEDFHRANEMEKAAGDGHLLRHGRDRHDELHGAREEKQGGKEGLKGPEHRRGGTRWCRVALRHGRVSR